MNIFDFLKNKATTKDSDNNLKQHKYKIAAESDALNNLGVMEYKNGNIHRAIEFYEKALKVMPENDDSLLNLAMCYNKLGLYEDAIELCHKAIKVDPERAIAYRTIGDAYYAQSNWTEVKIWYRESAIRGDQSTKNWLEKNGFYILD